MNATNRLLENLLQKLPLFIGNSFTQRNNLPALIASLAAEANIEVTHNLITTGGASL